MKPAGCSIIVFLFLVCCAGPGIETGTRAEELHYAFELNGNLVGYMEVKITRDGADPGAISLVETKVFAKLSLMEQGFDLSTQDICRLDPETGKVDTYETETTMGAMTVGGTAVIQDEQTLYTPKAGGETRTLVLTPEVIVSDPIHFTYLAEGWDDAGEKVRSFDLLDYNHGAIHPVTYTNLGTEKIELDGATYQTRVFDWIDGATGSKGRVWIDPGTGRFIRIELPNGIVIYQTRAAVADRIKRAELDDCFFARVAMPRVDFKMLSYMKVKASINTTGEWVTAESLNVPGQRFNGEVVDNRIEGVFEIAPQRYMGVGVPPFPPLEFEKNASLKKYLEPEALIESDDPAIIEKAQELTRGSRNAWDAVTRLSAWIMDEITYEIPGGSARRTLDARKGECGSQSRLLVAFCRAVKIPARVVSGCMYTPYFGGSFGTHSWAEVYMGEAGWIAVDATAGEIDYIDASHIRLGEKAAFFPEQMEVLDYSTGKERAVEKIVSHDFNRVVWEDRREASFRYQFKGTALGTDSFRIERIKTGENGDLYVGGTELALQGRSTQTEWKIAADGIPIAYSLTGKTGATDYSIECEFTDGSVTEKVVQAGQKFERTCPLEGRVYLIDNNNFSLFEFFVAGLLLEKDKQYRFNVFHPTSMEVLPLEVDVERQEEIVWNDTQVNCWVLAFNLDGTPFRIWIDEKGRILLETEQNGRFMVERIPAETD